MVVLSRPHRPLTKYCTVPLSCVDFSEGCRLNKVSVGRILGSVKSISRLPCSSSYHRLRSRALPGEKVPEVTDGGRFVLVLRCLSNPDGAVGGAAETGAAAPSTAASQREAQSGAQTAARLLGVGRGRGRLGQTQEVVVGVKLTHVTDGFTWRDVTCTEKEKRVILNLLLKATYFVIKKKTLKYMS